MRQVSMSTNKSDENYCALSRFCSLEYGYKKVHMCLEDYVKICLQMLYVWYAATLNDWIMHVQLNIQINENIKR